MNVEFLKSGPKKRLPCETQDAQGLNDYQRMPNRENQLAIPRVGIENFRLPLRYEYADGSFGQHDTTAAMYVFLNGDKTGVSMSRFCVLLQEYALKAPVNNNFFKEILKIYRQKLRETPEDKLIPRAFLTLKFSYPVQQKSLKSGFWGWQYYDLELSGQQEESGETVLELELKYIYSSTCPCSLSLAKQYEENFQKGQVKEGVGIAVAHSQRSVATCKVKYMASTSFKIEDLILLLRTALPTETQSLVKRVDEQAFAILNGENPMFVEHAVRKVAKALEREKRLIDWRVKVEHLESLHSHNAVAMIEKSFCQL